MQRRNLLRSTALGSIGCATLGSCRSSKQEVGIETLQTSQPSIRWRMAASWPKSLNLIFNSVEELCQKVSRMTNGRFTITPYEAGEIASGLEVLDAVQEGTVECGHTSGTYYVGKNPTLAFGTTLPFGLNAAQQNAWLYYGGGLATIQKLYADFGVINFPAGNVGAQMGGWFKQKINSVADLKGLKMRIPGVGAQVMSRLGVEVQTLPADEIPKALLDGKIDAVEWQGPYDDERLGLHRSAPFYYYPGWWEPGTALDVLVNLQAWNQLPHSYQEIFKAAATASNMTMLAQYNAANGAALERILLGDTQLISYNSELLKASQQAAFELYEDNASKDLQFREIYEQWKTFRSQIYSWHRVNELGFANFAFNTV